MQTIPLKRTVFMYDIPKEQYEALWYYCYGLTTDSDNDFHLYIIYDEIKEEYSMGKGIVTNYKIVNNDEVITINGDLDDAKEYFIKVEELFAVSEGEFLLSLSSSSYDKPDDEDACIFKGMVI